MYNRSSDKVDTTLAQAAKDGLSAQVHGEKTVSGFVASLAKPRKVIILVKAGQAVDDTIAQLLEHMEAGIYIYLSILIMA